MFNQRSGQAQCSVIALCSIWKKLFSANIDFIETHQQHTFLLDQLRKTCRNTITKVEETLWSIKFTCKLVLGKRGEIKSGF